MRILALKIHLYAPWVHSLKEKRMIIKSLIAKLRNKFNVSVSEIDAQDIHPNLMLGIAAIVAHQAQADSVAENLQHFIEQNTEAEIITFEKELL